MIIGISTNRRNIPKEVKNNEESSSLIDEENSRMDNVQSHNTINNTLLSTKAILFLFFGVGLPIVVGVTATYILIVEKIVHPQSFTVFFVFTPYAILIIYFIVLLTTLYCCGVNFLAFFNGEYNYNSAENKGK